MRADSSFGLPDFVFSVSSSNISPEFCVILEIVTAVLWMIPIGPKHRKPVLFARSFIRKEFKKLTEEMEEVLKKISNLALEAIEDPARPWLQDDPVRGLQPFDNKSVGQALEHDFQVPRDGLLWKMLQFKLENDEVAPLDEMNYLGLLCKVRAGQGERCLEDPNSKCILDGYWEELEIFRCADGCQTLAKKIAEKIKAKKDGPAKVFCNAAITRIELSSKNGARLWYKDTRDDRFVDEKAPPKPIPERFSYVVLAIPPSVWSPPAMTITADGKDADPAKRDRPDEHE